VLAALVDVARVGYPALFALVAVEAMGVPVPGETALITAAVLASNGHLEIALVIALAAAGAIVGDNIGYLIGRHGGRRLLESRSGPFAASRARVLTVGEPFFLRHGPKAVFFGRWILGLRVWASWLAGASHMPWRSFLFWNASGGTLWAVSIGLLAYGLGNAVEHVLKVAGIGAAVVVVLAIVAAAYVLHRKRHKSAASPPDDGLADDDG
jgi:membrane protein DedA with SNARE-associated domain